MPLLDEAGEFLLDEAGFPMGRHLHQHDARESAGELGQLASLPVAAMGCDGVGECADESYPVVPDDG